MKHWEDLTLETAERFGGQLPQLATADAIAAVYAKAPTAVLRAIEDTAQAYEDGTIRSPWGVLKARVERISVDQPKHQARSDLDKRVQRAEQWIRNAGLHYDSQHEVEDELYGERGRLRDHPETRDRLISLWHELRPLGQAAELEHQAYMQRAGDQRRAQTKPKTEAA